jgi:hypothetical protein
MSLLMRYILNIGAKVLLAVVALSFSWSVLAQDRPGRYLPHAGQAAPAFPFLQGANKEQADAAWQFYQKNIGQPMTKWARDEVRFAGKGTVLYPFSGPDFVTVSQLYPHADRYVMVAMQQAGAPASLEKMSGARAQNFQSKFLREWMKFSRLGFFRTDDLNQDLSDQQAKIGVTTILITFALYAGYDVNDVYPIALDPQSGEYVKTDTGWKSVRLMLSKGGKPVTLDYVSVDLSDSYLGQQDHADTRAWLERESHHPVLLKAASHLLQESYFSVLRDMLVANAPLVVQDETGLNYTALAKIGTVDLYGGFLYPHELFNRKKQESLARAYKESKNVKPLPFAFSYNKTSERRSLQIVRKKTN